MLLPLIEDDFVLAKMLPICAVLDNTAITVAIPNATTCFVAVYDASHGFVHPLVRTLLRLG